MGVAHQFNEVGALAGNLTWDQGATQGFTSQTDTWVAGLTAIVTPNKNVELKLTGSMGLMEGGNFSTAVLPGGVPNPVGYSGTFDDDHVYSLGASLTLRY